MSRKQELFEAIEANFNDLAENNAGTTKASQQRARKGSRRDQEIDYRLP